jgi:O-antigen ligase
MLNKTAIMASFISVLILVAYYSIRLKTISVISNLFIFIIFSAIAFTYINANFFTFHYDTSLLFDEGFSTDSFAIRVSVYSNALINFFKDPIVFLFGLGPTALETGTSGVVDIFKTDSSGLVQGTVDSTYVSYLVEMGVFSFIIIIYLLVAILDRILKLKIDSTNKTASITSLFISSSIIYFLISFFTQSLGYSKISWLFFIISFYVLNSSENSRLSQDDLVGIKENSI